LNKINLRVNFTPKPISKLAKKCPLKFSAFINLTNIITSHTKFQKNKTMRSGRKNKQVNIGFIFILMLHCLFLRPDPMVLCFWNLVYVILYWPNYCLFLRPDPMVLFFWNLVCDIILAKLRNAENFNKHFICQFWDRFGCKVHR
jgi:hypothetical protein